MIEILEELHTKYLPVSLSYQEEDNISREILYKPFFGGDELTEERARNATTVRSDGDTPYERLEGFIPKAEDWHAIRTLYQVTSNS